MGSFPSPYQGSLDLIPSSLEAEVRALRETLETRVSGKWKNEGFGETGHEYKPSPTKYVEVFARIRTVAGAFQIMVEGQSLSFGVSTAGEVVFPVAFVVPPAASWKVVKIGEGVVELQEYSYLK